MSGMLLRSRRFLPLFITQSCGALNDNLFKNALVMLVIFQAGSFGPALVAAAGGIFILPYALFSAMAGQLADRFDKSRLIRITKLWEVGLMLLASAGFLLGSMPALLAVLFGLGVQATFFSPLKYGILPDHLREEELVSGNALIETGTFASILIGTIAGGWLVLLPGGVWAVSAAGLAVALAGLAAAWAVPSTQPGAPNLRIGWNPVPETIALLREAKGNRTVWRAILGLSWFWTLGSIFLAEFPVIARDTLHADLHVVTLLLTCFVVGVGVGSMLVGRLLHGEVSARHVPFAALALSVFAADFGLACLSAARHGGLADAHAFLVSFTGWRMIVDLLMVAVCGGIFSVPLYAIIQEWSPSAMRARMVAASNVLNAAFMVAGAAAVAILCPAVLSAPGILLLVAAINLAVAIWIFRMLPQDVMQALGRWYFRIFHRVRVVGLENYAAAGERAVIVVNHMSFLDGALVASFLPGGPLFAVNWHMALKWWARPFLAVVPVFRVDPANPFSAKAMVKEVRAGNQLVIFPEGRLTKTGALMKVYDGAGLVADKADADVVPIRIDGPQFTRMTRLGGVLRPRLFPRFTMTILPPVRLKVSPGLTGHTHRQALGVALRDVMVDAARVATPTDRTMFAALVDAAHRYGPKREIAEDIERVPMAYRRLLLGAAVLGRHLARFTARGEHVGVLLPNANGALATFWALQAFGRVPAMLNVSTGADGMLSACTAATVRTVLCSRRFVERAKLDDTLARMEARLRIVWLEDVRREIGVRARLRGLWDLRRLRRLPGFDVPPDAPGVVLFTSGSEGTPKGVVLSHRNILANCAQLAAVFDFNPTDRVLNAMPMFHSFGLTGGTILPLLLGVRTFFYPSPLHYRIVPEMAYDSDATILFGTDTFLSGWARYAHPYDFRAVRYAFAGAEKVREETRRTYMDRFGVRVLEGYGATETAPALAINTAMQSRAGTVGRFLPGIEWRLEPVPGVNEGGLLTVRGPNVMLGYMRASAPGVLEPPEGGWYDTGDIVSVGSDGFVTINGRIRRFAKIAGEMVSMVAAEALACDVWPDAVHAVVNRPDRRKGERLLLVTTRAGAEAGPLLAYARSRGVSELMVPRDVMVVGRLPLLGSGKIDYPAVAQLVQAAERDAA